MDPRTDHGSEHSTCYDGFIKTVRFFSIYTKQIFREEDLALIKGEEPNSIFLYNIKKSETNQDKVD